MLKSRSVTLPPLNSNWYPYILTHGSLILIRVLRICNALYFFHYIIFIFLYSIERPVYQLNDYLVAMSETQPWAFFALQGLNFQFLEGSFKMSEL